MALCSECTTWVSGHARAHIRLPACVHCRGHAPLLRVRRAVLSPFASIALSAFPWVVTRSSFVTAFACTLLITVGTAIGAGWLFRFVVIGYFFDITRSTANGHDDAPLPADFRDVFSDMVDPALRLFLSVVWCWGAFTIASRSTHLDKPWVTAVLWLASACYVPVALLAAAARAPLFTVANPLTILGYLSRLGWDSLRLAGFSGVTLGLYAIVSAVEERIGGRAVLGLFGLNLLVFIPCTLLVVLLGMATFRAAGLLLRVRGDDLGYGPAEAYLVPLLGTTEPRGVFAEPIREEVRQPAAGASPWLEGAELPAQLRGEVEFALAPENSDGGLAQLARLVVNGQWDAALNLLRAAKLEFPAIALSAPSWIALGRHCTAAGEPRAALFAFSRASEIAPTGPFAPEACLLVADLARSFPQSAEGLAAAAWLRERALRGT